MIYAGIVAGGTGSRMGTDKPKQFIELGNRPILLRTVDKFLEISRIGMIYIAVHPDWLEYAGKLAEHAYSHEQLQRLRFIEGGADRNSSVIGIIDAIQNECGVAEGDILLTHDAVRPFVTRDIILRNIECVSKCVVCTTAVPATDTILYSENGSAITNTPDRSKLWQAQTPQTFRIKDFCEAYSALDDASKAALTDVCGVFTKTGGEVRIVKGDPSNIKLTTPFDLKLALSLI